MIDLEHYDITRARRTGEGTRTHIAMTCPICDEELTEDDAVYIGADDAVIGCCYCVRVHPAAEEIYK